MRQGVDPYLLVVCRNMAGCGLFWVTLLQTNQFTGAGVHVRWCPLLVRDSFQFLLSFLALSPTLIYKPLSFSIYLVLLGLIFYPPFTSALCISRSLSYVTHTCSQNLRCGTILLLSNSQLEESEVRSRCLCSAVQATQLQLHVAGGVPFRTAEENEAVPVRFSHGNLG